MEKRGTNSSDKVRQLLGLLPEEEVIPDELLEHPTGNENIIKWIVLIDYLVIDKLTNNENGINLDHLLTEYVIAKQILVGLFRGGCDIPFQHSLSLSIVDYEQTGDTKALAAADFDMSSLESYDFYWLDEIGQLEGDDCKLNEVLQPTVDSVCDILCFYRAYLEKTVDNMMMTHQLFDDTNLELDIPEVDILIDLGIIKSEEWKPSHAYLTEVESKVRELIDLVKCCSFKHRIPIEVDIARLLTDRSGALGHEAEGYSLGVKCYKNKYHPDFHENQKIQLLKELLEIQYAQNKTMFELLPNSEEAFLKHLHYAEKEKLFT